MPASVQEATDIVRIVCKYLRGDRATEMAQELVDKVGNKTDNDSLKVTLDMLLTCLQNFRLDMNARHSVHSIDGKDGLRTYEDESLGR